MEIPQLVQLAQAGDEAADRALLALAGSGSMDAQRAILDRLVSIPTMERLLQAEFLARIVALQGSAWDARRLASLLYCVGLEHRENWRDGVANQYAKEAFTILRDLLDDGDGISGDALAAMAPEFPDLWAAMEATPPQRLTAVDVPHDVTAVDVGPPSLVLPPLPWLPLTRWERIKFGVSDLGWSVRFKWWALTDALRDLKWKVIG